MPAWVQQGYQAYAKRMPADVALQLHEIPLQKRHTNQSNDKQQAKESQLMLQAIPTNAYCVGLEIHGKAYTTENLAQCFTRWSQQSANIALLIGGPEGLSDTCRARAQESWSLSQLTLPHPIVRVVLAEALYRAWTVTQGHPYHRT